MLKNKYPKNTKIKYSNPQLKKLNICHKEHEAKRGSNPVLARYNY